MNKTVLIKKNWDLIQSQLKDTPNAKVIPITKSVGIEEIKALYELGFREFGESRAEALEEKAKELVDYSIKWHFIGNLQKRKLPIITKYSHLIHSVSKLSTLEQLNKIDHKKHRILLQINIAKEEQKSGFTIEEFKMHAKEWINYQNIEICGLMTMAPHTDDHTILQNTFLGLKKLFDQFKATFSSSFEELSMGMSNDFIIAAQSGSTLIRIGSLFFEEENHEKN